MKAHQRVIREQKAKQDSDFFPLFGRYWENIDTDIKKATVKPIGYKAAEKIILQYEWLKCMPSIVRYSFGIYFDGYCGGVVCFGDEYAENLGVWDKYGYTGKILLLSRGACVHWSHPHSASKLIMGAIKQLPSKYEIITATTDSLAGEIGTIYQACNFHYVGVMRESLERSGWIINGKLYGSRAIRAKIGVQKKEDILKVYPNAQKIKQVSKSRYFLFRGSKKNRKTHYTSIKSRIKQYPKRND